MLHHLFFFRETVTKSVKHYTKYVCFIFRFFHLQKWDRKRMNQIFQLLDMTQNETWVHIAANYKRGSTVRR